MVLKRDPNWDGPGPGPYIEVPDDTVVTRDPNWDGPGPGPKIGVPDNSPVYQQVETEVSRVDNGDGTFTVTYRGSTDPNAPTYTRIVGTKTVKPVVAAPLDFTAASALYDKVGSRVTGKIQAYLDEVYAGMLSGKYSIADAENAFRIVDIQRDQGATGVEDPLPGDEPDPDPGGAAFVPAAGAETTIRAGLAKYGLENLFNVVWGKYTRSEMSLDDPDAFVYSLKNEQAYKDRFAANQIRIDNKKTELLPSTYLAMEDTYRKTLQASGLPPGFYDTQADLDKMIAGDVSIYELSTRIQDAYNVVRDAPADVTDKLKSLYGISDGDILAYFIDPDRARPQLIAADYKRQAQAAMVAGQAQRTANISLGAAFSEDVVRQNISEAAQKQAFTTIADMNELTRAQGNERDLSTEQIAGAQLGIDSASRKTLEDRKKGRVAGFSGGGEFSMQQAGGLGRSGIGQAGN